MEQKSYKKEQVLGIVHALSKRLGSNSLNDEILLSQVETLKELLDNLQCELSQAHSSGIQTHIPEATDELDAIVKMTEDATHTIMNSCETIQQDLKDKSAEETAVIDVELIKIVEACTFQDLTSQRISKILKILKNVDLHAQKLSEVIDETFPNLKTKKTAISDHSAEAPGLLNGPALPGEGITQDEIDRLLEDF